MASFLNYKIKDKSKKTKVGIKKAKGKRRKAKGIFVVQLCSCAVMPAVMFSNMQNCKTAKPQNNS